MNTLEFGDLLEELGFENFVGVPCSFLSPLINYAINKERFIMANNEGDAIAIASGISLANSSKKYGIALMQNSGLSNALSPLTSLNYVFHIPILGFVSLRGERDEDGNNTDEPQHELLGAITDKILEVCDIPYLFLEPSLAKAKEQLYRAKEYLKQGKPFFFIVRKGVLEEVNLEKSPIFGEKNQCKIESMSSSFFAPICSRFQALQKISEHSSKMVVLATTGKTGRELYEIADRENQLYMVGSMGCVGALGLGIALESEKKVLCIDGDGALLMRMGALSTNAYYANKTNRGNFCHILLDNQVHDSTGGQFSLSPYVDFAQIAKNCGYEKVFNVASLDELEERIVDFWEQKSGGAMFILVNITKGSKKDLGRPKIKPFEVAKRLQEFIGG